MQALFIAAAIAFAIGMPLNRRLTVRLGEVRKIGPFMKRSGDWLRFLAGSPRAYIYVIETKRHPHINILLHVPERHLPRFHALLRRWLVSSGFVFQEGLYKSERIHFSGPPDPNTELYLCGLERERKGALIGALRYLCKGIDPKAAVQFGIINPSFEGWVSGKRTGYAEILSPNRGLAAPLRHPKGYWLPSPELIRYDAVRACWNGQPELPLAGFRD